MKDRILQLLRAKFQGTQTIVLDSVAEHLSKTVTDESQLETAIAGVEPLVKSFATILQTTGDKRVSDAQKAFYQKMGLDENGKPLNPNPNPQPGGQANPVPGQGGEVPEWVKTTLQQQNENLLKLQQMLTGVVTTQNATQKLDQARLLMAKTKLPAALQTKWLSRIDVNSDKSLEDQVTSLEAEGLELQQLTINAAIERGEYVPSNSNPIGTDDELVKLIQDVAKPDDVQPGVIKLSV
jgi:hypothetical protein